MKDELTICGFYSDENGVKIMAKDSNDETFFIFVTKIQIETLNHLLLSKFS